MFTDKTLLITGGTGSFGNAVLKRFLTSGIKEIRIFSRDEKKQDDMRQAYRNDKIKYYIGDVRDYESLRNATKGVDFIFHAAALKQVPSCEFFPIEAVRTNVLGCANVLNAAIENGVKKVIVLSTDKAVYPINAMGLTKALSEKTMIAISRDLINTNTVFCGTRYGNVMGSRGSVIPLFADQIKSGSEITITDPNMTRFMMSLDDAVNLVLYAFLNGKQGDIFVQKSPAATIEMIANALMVILDKKVSIKIIGTRHGEKLHETLVNREEMVKSEDLGEYFCIPADNRDLNYGKYTHVGEARIAQMEEYTSNNTHRLTLEETIVLLKTLNL
jgi:UDP-glucose 4-epimerase